MSATSEFIRRSDAIEELKKWADGYKYIEQPTDNAIERFEQIPEGIVRCNECKLRQTDFCPMYWEEWFEYDEDGFVDNDLIIHDYTEDDGFCFMGDTELGEGTY